MKSTFLFLTIFVPMILMARERKTIYFPDGKVQYEYEMDGHIFDGRFSGYYESGKLRMKGYFTQNQKTGRWRFWDDRGVLRSERFYTSNLEYIVTNEYDSAGHRIPLGQSKLRSSVSCDFQDYMFSNKYLSVINKDHQANVSLFEEDGLIPLLLKDAVCGKITAYTNDRFMETVQAKSLASVNPAGIVSVLIKEVYYCCFANQIMNNQVVGICPVIMENGRPKEIGWFYVPKLSVRPDMIRKIRNHEFASTILKTSIKDPTSRLRAVSANENDLMRLTLIEFEANAILYTMDREMVATL